MVDPETLSLAGFLLFFLKGNGIALMIAAPVILALVFAPVFRPRKMGEKS